MALGGRALIWSKELDEPPLRMIPAFERLLLKTVNMSVMAKVPPMATAREARETIEAIWLGK